MQGRNLLIDVLKISPLVILPLLFYFRYLFLFHGYPAFENYLPPLNPDSLDWSVFFNGFQFNGLIITTPESAFVSDLLYNVPLFVLYNITSVYNAERAYILFSLVAYMASGYYLSGRVTNHYWSRLVGTIFLTFNPFMILTNSNGVPIQLLSEGLLFLSIAFLISHLKSGNKGVTIYWILSLVLLAMTIGFYQGFVLGTVLYFLVMLCYCLSDRINGILQASRRFLQLAAGSVLMILILIVPDVYPLYAGGYVSEFVANPGLANFIGNSLPPFDVIFLLKYTSSVSTLYLNATPLFGRIFLNLWKGIFIICLSVLIISPIFLRKKELGIISVGLILLSLLGSGADSFIYPFSSFLFLHFPGYASLNASYYWEWIIVIPLYFLLILNSLPPAFIKLHQFLKKVHLILHSKTKEKTSDRTIHGRYTVMATALVISFLILAPATTQSYYSTNGIGINNFYGSTMPPNYYEIQEIVKAFNYGSDGGVAYFNPDLNLFFNNSSRFFSNPMLYYPEQRTAELLYYAAPNLPSNTYFYWVYELFYKNETQYLGQLMGLAGIEYFVVLDGTNSYSYNKTFMQFSDGKDANVLMSYQKNVKLIYSGINFKIYRNLYYTGTVVNVSNLTLVMGGLNEIASLPYYGINLTSMGVVTTEDLNLTNYRLIMNKVGTIIIPETNSLYGAVLPSIANPIIVANYAKGTLGVSHNSWYSTLNLAQDPNEFYGIYSVSPLAVTDGRAILKIPIHVDHPGNWTLWIQVGVTSGNYAGYELKVSIGNSSALIDTAGSYNGISNTLIWKRINFYSDGITTLNITSLGGIENVGEVYVVPAGETSFAFGNFNQTVQGHKINIYKLEPTTTLQSNIALTHFHIVNNGIVNYTLTGYTINGLSNLTIVRLPFFNQLGLVNSTQKQYSVLFSINQLIMSSSAKGQEMVSFAIPVIVISIVETFLVAFFGILYLRPLRFKGLYRNRGVS